MKSFSLFIFLSFLVQSGFSQAEEPITFDIRMNEQVNILHFVDHLSQWSPYTGDDAVHLYTSEFLISKEDSLMLDLYKVNRERLEWESEIRLFNWAYCNYDFSCVPDSSVNDYKALKLVVDYFLERENERVSLKDILNNRYEKLEALKVDIVSYAVDLEMTFAEIKPYLKVWQDELKFSKYPIYICYSHKNNSSHGGANGDGVYSEFDVLAGKEFIETGFGIITHEITHKVTAIGETLLEMIQLDNVYPKSALLFMKKYDLTPNKLIEVFKSNDPHGFGNPEYKVFEEVYVYYISPVLIHQYSDDKIANKKVHYESKSLEELARIWYGVSLFKKEIEKTDLEIIDKEDLIWKLVEIYYEQIYYPNYKS